MSVGFDIDAYLARIGYVGPRKPDIETLTAVHALQPAAIPFENVDPLLGRTIGLDAASLNRKLVCNRRGGYCFELNSLFAGALEALGFNVTRLAARVRWGLRADSPERARTHMLLCVNLAEGRYLADVGFGGRLFSSPMPFESGREHYTVTDTLRLERREDVYTLQALSDGEWGDLYRFIIDAQVAADYEVANWFLCTHPTSFFRSNLLAERLTPECRLSLFNTRLTRTEFGGAPQIRFLTLASELSQVLRDDFDLSLPVEVETLWSLVAKAAGRSTLDG
jgi:N-hydroxyarylamine O-acetyltransferase